MNVDSNRLDWRFLMPNPNLGKVLYVGPADTSLYRALRLSGTPLAAVDPAWQWKICGQDPIPAALNPVRYDLLVACDPSYETLERALQRILPGGYLYLEARRRSKFGGRPLRHAGQYVRALRRLGFGPVEAHWHWPDFESSTEIVPLADPKALAHAFSRRQSGPVNQLKSALGRGLVKLGVFERVVPCFSVVACKHHLKNDLHADSPETEEGQPAEGALTA